MKLSSSMVARAWPADGPAAEGVSVTGYVIIGDGLYTIHIPTSSPMKPIVKLIRRTTWQGFEAMHAQKCGQYGTLLLGIDHDTNNSYLYAVSHATGTSTIIKSLGKIPTNYTFPGPVYFRWKNLGEPLTGE